MEPGTEAQQRAWEIRENERFGEKRVGKEAVGTDLTCVSLQGLVLGTH